MNKRNLELFGLTEAATKEDISSAYEALRAKYLEERFMDGEAGNNAAKMLTKIEAAYNELMSELAEAQSSDDLGGGAAFDKVETLIKEGNLQEAQHVLDNFNERGARWHYLQSVVFYKKNWMNESKKQLEIAMQLEPDNEKYKEAYRKLVDKINFDTAKNPGAGAGGANQSIYEGQTMNAYEDDQMGGNFCADCVQCCAINACLNCFCNACCH